MPANFQQSELPFGGAGFLCALVVLFGCQRSEPIAPTMVAVPNSVGTVTIEVTSGDQVQTFTVDDVRTGSTVEEVMRSATDLPSKITGSGTTAFVQSLDGKATSATDGWTYMIDGEFSNAGIGSITVSPPATITWTYGEASEFGP